MAGNSFTQKLLSFVIQLVPNPSTLQPATFNESGSNVVTISNARAEVHINASGSTASIADVKIYGLAQSLMNQLQSLGMQYNQAPVNVMTIFAGDAVSGLSQIFAGRINMAYGGYDQAPNVPMLFEVQAGGGVDLIPAVATTFPVATDVATVMANFARQLAIPCNLENGLPAPVKMPPSYHGGTIADQIQDYANMAHIKADIVDGGKTLAIYPIGGSRLAGNTQTLSPTTGMVGYPTFTQAGIIVKTIFNPLIGVGSLFNISGSSLPQANGTWTVNVMNLDLATLLPGGQWLQTIEAYDNKVMPVPPVPTIQ